MLKTKTGTQKELGRMNRAVDFHRRHCRGQVVVEYVAVLAILLTLTLAMIFLLRALGEDGVRTTELVTGSVP